MPRELAVAAALSAKSLVFSFLILGLVACSTGPSYEIVSRETADQQALQEVMSAPLKFSVPTTQANQVWDRARMFFVFYIGKDNANPEELYETKADWISNERVPDQKYSYRISRQQSSGQVAFLVKCFARPGLGGTPEKAEQNAHNLSRFMQYGYLEVSLLDS